MNHNLYFKPPSRSLTYLKQRLQWRDNSWYWNLSSTARRTMRKNWARETDVHLELKQLPTANRHLGRYCRFLKICFQLKRFVSLRAESWITRRPSTSFPIYRGLETRSGLLVLICKLRDCPPQKFANFGLFCTLRWLYVPADLRPIRGSLAKYCNWPQKDFDAWFGAP